MAKLVVDGAWLVMRLNWLEKFGALSVRNVRVPVEAIESVEVVDDPHGQLLAKVDLGFAGDGAPARKIMTLMTRAQALGGGRVAVAEYLNRPAVVVHLRSNETRWRLLVVSSKRAALLADAVRSGIAA